MDQHSSDNENQSVSSDAERNMTPSNRNEMRLLKYSWDEIMISEEVSQFCLLMGFFFGNCKMLCFGFHVKKNGLGCDIK